VTAAGGARLLPGVNYRRVTWGGHDLPRRRAAGIPAGLEFATRPQLAMRQLEQLADADAALDLQGGMMALVALRDAAAKVFRLTTAGRLIAVFRTVAEVAARD
jgi:hypothetical protein